MPDTPERQKEHAEEKRSQRHLMNNLGVTRETARQILTRDAARMREQAQAQKKADVVVNEPPKPPPPTITTDITKFEPRPMTLGIEQSAGQQAAGAGKDGSSSTFTGTKRLIVIDDGVPNYYDFPANLVGPV